MRVGIIFCGLGNAASGGVIKTAAQIAERVGFASFWLGEHVVLFAKDAEANYPISEKIGRAKAILIDPNTPLSDPIVGMSWAAAATSTIEIGSAIIILPQRNPLILAKELSTLDSFSGGRVVLGVGTGWSQQEYAAVGADWANRGRRMDEYVGALRALWRDTPASFQGDTIQFEGAYLLPKPLRNDIPIVFGGENDAVLKRVARSGDGWMPVKLTPEDAPGKVALLRALTQQQGRDPDRLRIIQSINSRTSADDLKRYRDAGVTEFKLSCFGELPVDDAGLAAALEDMAGRFVAPVAGW